MAHKLFSLVLMLVLALPVVIFAFAGDETKAPMPAEVMQKQIADALKVYGEKKEVYRKDVLDLFERKEKFSRDKGDLKTLNLIKKEKDAFFENGKDPTLFFVTDQKRFLELAKFDLIKAYEKTIKDCLKMKLDVEAEGFSKELEEIRAGKIKVEEKKAKPIFLEAPFSAEVAKTTQMELAKSLGKSMESKIDLGKGVKLEMVLIPAGKFMMGSPASEVGRKSDETQHEVTLTKPFYMGKYEVTQEQWQVIMGNNPSQIKGARLPVTNVSWNDCQDFIKKLNAKTNDGYRLPSEAEWEYACRAGTKSAYVFGNIITKSDVIFGKDSTMVVGSYKTNFFGLYDMHGNVWEWCEDWYGDYPAGAVTDPKGPAEGGGPVLRGGAFGWNSSDVRSSERRGIPLTVRSFEGGFRLARTVDFKVTVVPPAPKPIPTKLKQEEEIKVASIEKEMVLIPAGKFMMGDPGKDHEVTLTKPFYMGKYEVTQEQWQAVMGSNPSRVKGAIFPVTNVSWNDCQDFIKKLNVRINGVYRLPTEAEWEYACRAGTTTAYSFGDNITPKNANYEDSKIGKPIAVGSYKPNAFGLYDMHGNVFEWCEDWFGVYPAGVVTDPKGPATGIYRWMRGGAFLYPGSSARSSSRGHYSAPTFRNDLSGFRLAMTP